MQELSKAHCEVDAVTRCFGALRREAASVASMHCPSSHDPFSAQACPSCLWCSAREKVGGYALAATNGRLMNARAFAWAACWGNASREKGSVRDGGGCQTDSRRGLGRAFKDLQMLQLKSLGIPAQNPASIWN